VTRAESIEAMRQQLLTATTYGRVLDLFWALLRTDERFIDDSAVHADPELLRAVRCALGIAVGRQLPAQLYILRLAEHGFVHGSFEVDGRKGGLLWFETAGVGLVALPEGRGTRMVRFRLGPPIALGDPARN
jgi:hypothetical protein